MRGPPSPVIDRAAPQSIDGTERVGPPLDVMGCAGRRLCCSAGVGTSRFKRMACLRYVRLARDVIVSPPCNLSQREDDRCALSPVAPRRATFTHGANRFAEGRTIRPGGRRRISSPEAGAASCQPMTNAASVTVEVTDRTRDACGPAGETPVLRRAYDPLWPIAAAQRRSTGLITPRPPARFSTGPISATAPVSALVPAPQSSSRQIRRRCP